MLVGGDFYDENPLKGVKSVLVIADRGEEYYLGRRGIPVGGVTPMMINP